MIKIKAGFFVCLATRTDTARHYVKRNERTGCQSCPAVKMVAGDAADPDGIPHPDGGVYAPFTSVCEEAGHTRKRCYETEAIEQDPREARAASNVAGEIRRRVGAAASYSVGSGVYLVSQDRMGTAEPGTEPKGFRGEIAALRKLVTDTNAGYRTCRVAFDLYVGEISPTASDLETLASAKGAIDGALRRLLDAVKAGDVTGMRDVVRETKHLASLLDGQAGLLASETAAYVARTADAVRDAGKLGEEHVALTVKQARVGAERFAALWADLGADVGSGPVQVATPTPAPEPKQLGPGPVAAPASEADAYALLVAAPSLDALDAVGNAIKVSGLGVDACKRLREVYKARHVELRRPSRKTA